MARYRLSENKLRGMIREAVNDVLNKEINEGFGSAIKKAGKFAKNLKRKFDDSIYDLTREDVPTDNPLNPDYYDDEDYDPRESRRYNNNHSLNESAVGGIIKKWCYWCANYDYYFIEKAWADNRNLAEHLRSKFMSYYEDVGPYGVMTKFYLNLDNHNREILEDYVMNNFNC